MRLSITTLNITINKLRLSAKWYAIQNVFVLNIIYAVY
jgi:hypothetical protein